MQHTVTLDRMGLSLPINSGSSSLLNKNSFTFQENSILRELPNPSPSIDRVRKILVIDRNGSTGDLIRHSLANEKSNNRGEEPAHCEVAVTSDWHTASNIMALSSPDLIIADWSTIASSIPSELNSVYTAPVLLLIDRNIPFPETGLGEITSGIVDCIQRPVDATELMNRVQVLLGFTDKLKQMREETTAIKDNLNLKHIELHLELLMQSGSVKDKFIEEISQLYQFLTIEGRSKLKHLVKQFRWALNDEKSTNFIKTFDKLNESLYSHLDRICIGITKNEKRLCAFARKDQSSAEIAKLLGKTQNCVNVAFARIRMKLKLANNKDLKTFLNSLDK